MDDVQFQFKLFPANKRPDEFTIEWGNLIAQLNCRSFIHYSEWFTSRFTTHPDRSQNAWFVTLHINHKLSGIFPLEYITQYYYGLKLKVWRIFWPSDMGINDFIYLQNSPSEDILSHLITFLNQQLEMPWNLLHLQKVPDNSCIANSLNMFSPPRHVQVYSHDSKYIACKTSFDDTLSGVSSKFKRNNRRKLRKLENSGTVHYKMAENENDLRLAFEQFIEIEAANWKGKNETALKHDKPQQKFYHELLNRFGRSGLVRIHSLWLDDQPIASQFALNINDTFHMLKIGYDAKYHDVGPGSILLNETIRHFSGDDKVNKISFVTGAKWNDSWAPMVIRVYDHYVFNSNPKGYIIFFIEKTKSLLRPLKHKLQSGKNKEK